MAAHRTKSGLSGSLADRRRRQEEAADVHKLRDAPAFDRADQLRIAGLLSNDIAVALSAQIDELNTYHHGFRAALTRVFIRVLRLSSEKPEQVVLFHEAVPGFTLMLFKKDPPSSPSKQPGAASARPSAPPPGAPACIAAPHPLEATAEGRAAEVLIGEFFSRTGSRVMIVEHTDSLFVFFPAADLRKNVRELGYFDLE
jgi:hypothetical protein